MTTKSQKNVKGDSQDKSNQNEPVQKKGNNKQAQRKQTKQTTPKDNGGKQKEEQQVVPKAKVRESLIANLANNIKASKLTSFELLLLLDALGTYPLHNTKYNEKLGQQNVFYTKDVGPNERIFKQFSYLFNRMEIFRKLILSAPSATKEDFELLGTLNASGFDEYGKEKTPECFASVQETISDLLDKINERITFHFAEKDKAVKASKAEVKDKRAKKRTKPAKKETEVVETSTEEGASETAQDSTANTDKTEGIGNN